MRSSTARQNRFSASEGVVRPELEVVNVVELELGTVTGEEQYRGDGGGADRAGGAGGAVKSRPGPNWWDKSTTSVLATGELSCGVT